MLPLLNPDPKAFVDVQQTEFSYDVLGRWSCSTWNEVSNNGGDPFDIVVIGAGMFGGYIADKLYRRAENIGLRVLVLDAGSFFLPTHTQNLPRLALSGPTEQVVASNAQDPGPQMPTSVRDRQTKSLGRKMLPITFVQIIGLSRLKWARGRRPIIFPDHYRTI